MKRLEGHRAVRVVLRGPQHGFAFQQFKGELLRLQRAAAEHLLRGQRDFALRVIGVLHQHGHGVLRAVGADVPLPVVRQRYADLHGIGRVEGVAVFFGLGLLHIVLDRPGVHVLAGFLIIEVLGGVRQGIFLALRGMEGQLALRVVDALGQHGLLVLRQQPEGELSLLQPAPAQGLAYLHGEAALRGVGIGEGHVHAFLVGHGGQGAVVVVRNGNLDGFGMAVIGQAVRVLAVHGFADLIGLCPDIRQAVGNAPEGHAAVRRVGSGIDDRAVLQQLEGIFPFGQVPALHHLAGGQLHAAAGVVGIHKGHLRAALVGHGGDRAVQVLRQGYGHGFRMAVQGVAGLLVLHLAQKIDLGAQAGFMVHIRVGILHRAHGHKALFVVRAGGDHGFLPVGLLHQLEAELAVGQGMVLHLLDRGDDHAALMLPQLVDEGDFLRRRLHLSGNAQVLPVQGERHRDLAHRIVVHDLGVLLLVDLIHGFGNDLPHQIRMGIGILIIAVAGQAQVVQREGDIGKPETAVRGHIRHGFRRQGRSGIHGADLHAELAVLHRNRFARAPVHQGFHAFDIGGGFDIHVGERGGIPVALRDGHIVRYRLFLDGIFNQLAVPVLGQVIDGQLPQVGIGGALTLRVHHAGQQLLPVGIQVNDDERGPQGLMLRVPLPLLAHLHLHALRIHEQRRADGILALGDHGGHVQSSVAVVAHGHFHLIDRAVRGVGAFLALLHGVVHHGLMDGITVGLAHVGHAEGDGLEGHDAFRPVGGGAHRHVALVADLKVELALGQGQYVGRLHGLFRGQRQGARGVIGVHEGRLGGLVAHDHAGIALRLGLGEAARHIGFFQFIGSAVGQALDDHGIIGLKRYGAAAVGVRGHGGAVFAVQDGGVGLIRQLVPVLVRQGDGHGKDLAVLRRGHTGHGLADLQAAVLAGIQEHAAVALAALVGYGGVQGALAVVVLHVHGHLDDALIIVHGGIVAGHLADIIDIIAFCGIADAVEDDQALTRFIHRRVLLHALQRLPVRQRRVGVGIPIRCGIDFKGIDRGFGRLALHLLLRLKGGHALHRVGVGEAAVLCQVLFDQAGAAEALRLLPAGGQGILLHLVLHAGGDALNQNALAALELRGHLAAVQREGHFFRAAVRPRAHGGQLGERFAVELQRNGPPLLILEGHRNGERLILGSIGLSADGLGDGQLAGLCIVFEHAVARVPVFILVFGDGADVARTVVRHGHGNVFLVGIVFHAGVRRVRNAAVSRGHLFDQVIMDAHVAGGVVIVEDGHEAGHAARVVGHGLEQLTGFVLFVRLIQTEPELLPGLVAVGQFAVEPLAGGEAGGGLVGRVLVGEHGLRRLQGHDAARVVHLADQDPALGRFFPHLVGRARGDILEGDHLAALEGKVEAAVLHLSGMHGLLPLGGQGHAFPVFIGIGGDRHRSVRIDRVFLPVLIHKGRDLIAEPVEAGREGVSLIADRCLLLGHGTAALTLVKGDVVRFHRHAPVPGARELFTRARNELLEGNARTRGAQLMPFSVIIRIGAGPGHRGIGVIDFIPVPVDRIDAAHDHLQIGFARVQERSRRIRRNREIAQNEHLEHRVRIAGVCGALTSVAAEHPFNVRRF